MDFVIELWRLFDIKLDTVGNSVWLNNLFTNYLIYYGTLYITTIFVEGPPAQFDVIYLLFITIKITTFSLSKSEIFSKLYQSNFLWLVAHSLTHSC